MDWYRNPNVKYLTFGGYAGTGKTTLLGYLGLRIHRENKKIRIAYCSFTGKASRVLDRKLRDVKALTRVDYIGTIHRLIYRAIVDDNDNIIGWEKKFRNEFEYDLIIVDEASMVTKEIWSDLLSFDVPILAVGDHGQLPPIEDNFNLMENPSLRLEEIFRQERDNPIILISEMVRKYGGIPKSFFSDTVRKLSKDDNDTQDFITDIFSSFDNQTMVLVGYNNTRINLNKGIRQHLEFDTETPDSGDRVICLKNNSNVGIYNGMMGTIISIYPSDIEDSFEAVISLDGEEEYFSGLISEKQFNNSFVDGKSVINGVNLFDFGYALTVHKAQGSQAKRVVVFEERFPHMSDEIWRRWLYTAVTRAEEELYIIG